MLVVGCIQSSQPLRSTAAAWPQWSTCAWVQTSSRTCSSRRPTCVERALQVRQRAGLVHAACRRARPVAGRERPGVAVRHPRPGQRQPQPPDAGHDALAAPHLVCVAGVGDLRTSAGRANVRGHGQPTPPGRLSTRYFDALGAARSRRRSRRAGRRTASTASSARPTRMAPDGVRAYFGELFAAVPDFALEVRDDHRRGRPRRRALERDGHVRGRRRLQGIAPTGGRIEIAGLRPARGRATG